jgi:methylglutaconyl-CoA hydratase
MMPYKTIETELNDRVLTVWLNRPEIHNAFDETMLREVTDCFENLDPAVLCVVLRGRGKSFCAGVDLNWMKSISRNSYEENYQESLLLSKCFLSIYTCPKPTIAVVHGVALGGANGLLAACDIAYCSDDAVFSLSEVKIGIIPACISPYIVKRVGEYGARELMLTGRRITGPEAQQMRLVNKSVAATALEQALWETIAFLRTSGPEAMAQGKRLLFEICNNMTLEEAYDFTARMIAEIRSSSEGQEGMAAFLEKRKPNWMKE